MKYLSKITLLFLSLFLISCANHNGYVSNALIPNTNFKVVGIASGTEVTKKVFGIGGLNKNSLVFNAKQNMYTAYPLKKGQIYGTITLDFKTSRFLIYSKTQVNIHADIIDFDSTRISTLDSVEVFTSIKRQYNLKLGEKVIANHRNKWKEMTITKIAHKSIFLKYLDKNKNEIIVTKLPSNVFKLNNNFDNETVIRKFNIGDTVTCTDYTDDSINKVRTGKIIALQSSKYLIHFPDGIESVNAKDIR